jgi:hypothetical protein
MNLIVISSHLKDQLGSIEIPNSERLIVDCSDKDSYFINIARCCIALERHLIVDGKSILWTNDPKYNTVTMIWDKNHIKNLVPSIEKWKDIRGDEIVFNSLQYDIHRGWALGNPRSIIKWASCVLNVENIDFTSFPHHEISGNNKSSRLVWLAFRIGLKVYGVE